MRILVGCEESQVVCNAFREKGHEAYSCDIVPTRGAHPEWHIQDDIRNLLFATGNYESHPYPTGAPEPGNRVFWDVMIAHPDCRCLTNSGVRWLYNRDGTKNSKRWWDMINAASFFNLLFDGISCKIPKICIENPIPHKHAGLPKYTQIIQPWMFGHMEQKSTCLWLKGLPPLKETNNVYEAMMKLPKRERESMAHVTGTKPCKGPRCNISRNCRSNGNPMERRMPGQITHQERIERYAEQMCVGEETTASEVVKALGNRHICGRSVGQGFQSLPILEFVKKGQHGAGKWKRVDEE